MSANVTRGRSYTSFPRNTKQAYLISCATAAREAEVRRLEVELAYQEHTPFQNCSELLKLVAA